jgi:hypothetical protein
MQYNLSICTETEPELESAVSNHLVRCWLYSDHGDHRAPIRL